MPFSIVRNDITKMQVDAIVNAGKRTLLGGGGVDGAIHKAAGKGLLAECKTLGGCEVGEAKVTGAYELPCKYVIHTVGPVWKGGMQCEKELLRACYINSLNLAKTLGCKSVAFPLISSGTFRFPKSVALKIATDAMTEFLRENEMNIVLVLFDEESFREGKRFFEVTEYINDRYCRLGSLERQRNEDFPRFFPQAAPIQYKEEYKSSAFGTAVESEDSSAPSDLIKAFPSGVPLPCHMLTSDLSSKLSNLDESFSQMLLRKIDECGMTDVQCYKKANIDRKLFSKIRSDIHYKPKKATALAFAIALELSLDETSELLEKAGFALSHSSKFDIIIEYFIENRNYNIFEINETLYAFDQSLLGA